MARYIDADRVMEEINRIGGHNLCEWETIGVKALIDRQPTADVVEAVRCKDCIYWDCYSGEDYHKGDCTELVGLDSCMYEDDFCSYGKRKNGGEEE